MTVAVRTVTFDESYNAVEGAWSCCRMVQWSPRIPRTPVEESKMRILGSKIVIFETI